MSKEKQIFQLRCKGYSQRRIADTLKVSYNTVSRVFKAYDAHTVDKQEIQTYVVNLICIAIFFRNKH